MEVINMKLKNKKWITLSIIVGIALLATTALADNISKSPYDQLKAVIKSTTAQMSGTEVTSYTAVTRFSLKDNNILLMEKINEQKSASGGSEHESKEITTTSTGSVMTSYSFNNKKKNIWYDRYNDVYYLSENEYYEEKFSHYDENYYGGSRDPLANEHIDDMERIFDAVVGNLKNYVTVVKNDDGTLEFTGSLSDAQIPAIINAVASFLTKQFLASTGGYAYDSYDDAYAMPRAVNELEKPEPAVYNENKGILNIPKLVGDVFIKSVSGRAVADENGIITSVYADIVLSGRDEEKNVHEVNFEIEMNLTDINSTEITEPDLTGKNVQINEFNNERPQERLTSQFEGTYKSEIVKTIDGKFEKIGERFVVIEKIDENEISGRYFEVYKDGYESADPVNFEFSGGNYDPYSVNISFIDSNGKSTSGNIYFDYNSASIQFYSDSGYEKFSSGFNRVFE